MDYAGNTEIIRKHFHAHQENLCRCAFNHSIAQNIFFNEVVFIQGAFKNIQGLLWEIQGLCKDISHNVSIFKDFSRPVRTMNCLTS